MRQFMCFQLNVYTTDNYYLHIIYYDIYYLL